MYKSVNLYLVRAPLLKESRNENVCPYDQQGPASSQVALG